MSGLADPSTPPPVPPPLPGADAGKGPPARSSVIISCGVIAAAIAVIMVSVTLERRAADRGATIALLQLEMQAKNLVGLQTIAGFLGPPSDAMIAGQIATTVDSLAERAASPAEFLALATTRAYLEPENAEGVRTLLESGRSAGPEEPEAYDRFGRLLLEPGEASDADWEAMEEAYPWFGEFARVAGLGEDDADRAAFSRRLIVPTLVYLGFTMVLMVALLCGFILLILALVALRRGRLPFHFRPARASAPVYLEAFAVFLAAYVAADLLVLLLPEALRGPAAMGFLLLGYLAALLWIPFRGIPVGTMLRQVGFHRGRGWLREMVSGVAGYLAMMPLVAVALGLVLALVQFLGAAPPSHPIAEQMRGSGWFGIAFVLFLGAVFAPVFEEILFRGILYRSLRGWFGVLASCVVTAVLFAAIHPQGVLAIPVLSALAIGFALIREWRDSLVACITAHALNNFTVIVLLVVMTGGQ